MYAVMNFQKKKDLVEAVAKYNKGEGPKVTVFAPGLGQPKENGREFLEGPHFVPHTWYAQVEMRDGAVVKVVK